MNVLAFICLLVAMILFALAAVNTLASRFNLVAAGLFFLTLGLTVQFGAKTHTLTF
jgi:hypothetical protein